MNCRNTGFTLLELAVVVGIIAILAAAALLGYQHYVNKAASAELIEQYDELRERASLAVSEGANLCDDPQKELSPGSVLYNPHAELSIVRADPDIIGLHIKADVAGEGEHNTAIAREAYNVLNQSSRVVAGAVVMDSAVSFVALLANTNCGANIAQTSPCPSGQTRLSTGECTKAPPPGQAPALAQTAAPSQQLAPPTPQAPQAPPLAPVCRMETVPPADTALHAISRPGMTSGGPVDPSQPLRPPPPSKPIPEGDAPGSECIVCGDVNQKLPCSPLDLELAITAKCPDDKPICSNTIEYLPNGQVGEYRLCVDRATADANAAKSDGCANNTYSVESRPGATCAHFCYDDGGICNDFDPGATLAGTTRLVCN